MPSTSFKLNPGGEKLTTQCKHRNPSFNNSPWNTGGPEVPVFVGHTDGIPEWDAL